VAQLSPLQMLRAEVGAEDNCEPAVEPRKAKGPVKFTGWDQKAGIRRNAPLGTTRSGATAWELSLGRGRQKLMHVHGNVEITATLRATCWSKTPLF